MKKLITLLLLVCAAPFIFNSCVSLSNMRQSLPNLPSYGVFKNNDNPIYPALIRLHNSNDFFYCSGFVIDGIYAMTAAHCVLDDLSLLSKEEIKVYDAYSNFATTAKAVGVDRYLDVAFVKGDFSKFEHYDVDFTGKESKRGMMVKSCGFPAGQFEIYCTELQHFGNQFFKYRTKGGPIYKGMSGGPVVEIKSGKVIGVNSAVEISTVVIGPVIGSLESVGIK